MPFRYLKHGAAFAWSFIFLSLAARAVLWPKAAPSSLGAPPTGMSSSSAHKLWCLVRDGPLLHTAADGTGTAACVLLLNEAREA